MAETRIQLCGRLVVELEGRRVEGVLPGRQGRLLWVYLAANRVRAISRSELVEALWPGDAPGSVESALSALISKLRRVVGAQHVEGRSDLRLVLPGDAWIDLEAASEAIHRAESAVAQREWASAWAPARVALTVARRGFLPWEEAPWVELQRQALEEVELRALECIGHSALGLGGPELAAAGRSARALVRLTPYRESGHRLLMETLAAEGNVAEALAVYDSLRCRLRDDLGVAPSGPTKELHRLLLSG